MKMYNMIKALGMAMLLGLSYGVEAQTQECERPGGPDSSLTIRNYSLYREDFRSKRYDAAYESWLYVFNNAPCFREQLYADGPEFMEAFLKKAKDDKRKKELLDTLDLIYKRRIQYFGKEGFVKAKWGKDVLTLDPSNVEKGIKLIEEAIALDGNNLEDAAISPYFQAIVSQEKKKALTKDDVLAVFEKLSSIVDYNVKNNSVQKVGIYRSGVKVENLQENTFSIAKPEALEAGMIITLQASYNSPRYEITNVDSNLVTVAANITEPNGSEVFLIKDSWKVNQEVLNAIASPYLDCKTLVAIYNPKYLADPLNTELMNKILLFLNNGRCTDNDLYITVSEASLKQNPNAEGYRTLAKAYKNKKNNSKALDMLEKAASLETDNKLKVNDYLAMARIAIENKNAMSAKQYADRALAINPNKGEAYILIGDAYSLSSGACSEKLDKSALYWVVVDMYEKAKSVDAGIAGAANRRIATYSKYFPDKKDAFFWGITDGTYTLTCWPSLSTRVRFNN